METSFIKANRKNLPKIDAIMVAHFFANNPGFFAEESKNVKNSLTSRDGLNDDAVGYVQLQRDSRVCTVKCKIYSDQSYHRVTMVVDENESVVTTLQCHDCVDLFGCKHSAGFLLWVHRRYEEPADTISLWRKPFNAEKLKFIKVAQMTGKSDIEEDPSFLSAFINEAKTRQLRNNRLLNHFMKYNKELIE